MIDFVVHTHCTHRVIWFTKKKLCPLCGFDQLRYLVNNFSLLFAFILKCSIAYCAAFQVCLKICLKIKKKYFLTKSERETQIPNASTAAATTTQQQYQNIYTKIVTYEMQRNKLDSHTKRWMRWNCFVWNEMTHKTSFGNGNAYKCTKWKHQSESETGVCACAFNNKRTVRFLNSSEPIDTKNQLKIKNKNKREGKKEIIKRIDMENLMHLLMKVGAIDVVVVIVVVLIGWFFSLIFSFPLLLKWWLLFKCFRVECNHLNIHKW